jgi:hypothetical protein
MPQAVGGEQSSGRDKQRWLVGTGPYDIRRLIAGAQRFGPGRSRAGTSSGTTRYSARLRQWLYLQWGVAFTATEFPCGGTAFCDANLAQRNGSWAVDITGVDSATDITNGAAAPEPGSILLLATGLTSLALLRRRRKQV